ncbi:LLM class flavin-dependent oxidoreductase [Paenibacillaceae bacterium]|nr:LLM class flavin-dependent oxidoreductase [Paenibacillaceae bacterium]
MKLSVLDQGYIPEPLSASEALKEAVELAKLADELGYERIWYSEHHGSGVLLSAAPEIMIAHIAAVTPRIRVGSGGVMMMHYPALKIAETFKLLSTMYPGRIDLGVGRASGADADTLLALSEGRTLGQSDLFQRLTHTLLFMTEKWPIGHPYGRTTAAPQTELLPEVWLLGSSGGSASRAGKLGIGYSFGHFMGGKFARDIADNYHRHFEPSAVMPKAKINAGFFVIACETAEEAEYQAATFDLTMLELCNGNPNMKLVSPEQALSKRYTQLEKDNIKQNRSRVLVGSIKDVAEKLLQLEHDYGIGEAMVATLLYDCDTRLNNYRLLARELMGK